MDQEYGLYSLEFSLTKMCAFTVAHQVFEASINLSADKPDYITEYEAVDRIAKLRLPPCLKELVKVFIKPVSDELRRWQKNLQYFIASYRPVFTMHGTVDLHQSIEPILGDKKAVRLLESTLGRKFGSNMQNLGSSKLLTMDKIFRVAGVERDLPMLIRRRDMKINWDKKLAEDNFGSCARTAYHQMHSKEFQLAIYKGDTYTVADLLEQRVNRRSIACCMIAEFGYSVRNFENGNLPPAMILEAAKFQELRRRPNEIGLHHYAPKVLNSLLNWPYQPFFLTALPNLASYINTHTHYWPIIKKIARKHALGYKECDYGEFFNRLWLLGAEYGLNSFVSHHGGHEFVFYVMMTKHKCNISLVLDEVSPILKESLMLDVRDNTICSTLLVLKEFTLLETFVRACAMNRKDLLVVLKETIAEICSVGPLVSWCTEFNHERWRPTEWKEGMHRFTNIMDKLIAETDCS